VIQSLVESGVLEGKRGGYSLKQPVESLGIPPNVQTLVGSRIDRLPEGAKHVLRRAAVIGRDVPEELLIRVAELAEPALRAGLGRLQDAGLLREVALFPSIVYAFNHPVTQEVAYDSQLRERRFPVHAAVAKALEEIYPDRLDEQAARVADHWERAGESLKAAIWSYRAAQWTLKSDVAEGVRNWELVLERAMRSKPEQNEVVARLALGAAWAVLGYGGAHGLPPGRAREVFEAVRELAGTTRVTIPQVGSPEAWLPLLETFYADRLGISEGKPDAALHHAREATRRAKRVEDPGLYYRALLTWSRMLWLVGRYREAIEITEAAVAEPPQDLSIGAPYDAMLMPPFSGMCASRAPVLASLGRIQEARELLDRFVPRDSQLYHHFKMLCAWLLGEVEELDAHADACQLPDESGCSNSLLAIAASGRGYAALWQGRWQEAAAQFGRAIELGIANRALAANAPLYLAALAEARAELGDEAGTVRALRNLARASRVGLTVDGRVHVSRVRALLALGRARLTDAEAALSELNQYLDRSEADAYRPFACELSARIAHQRGDAAARDSARGEAQRLWTRMGAPGHVARIARDLEELRVG
jgi:adenylate cyclase